ncbi:alanyl-tRNA editing protein [Anaeromyxobacter terrae]|uniref:alanyl-tRNA editing protein n=1 Tax=Anaeromyxobacter terrae TaxID=2925406 RepID=UPI001F5AB8E9|nr:alanyl-tRNA editing protein [Anaeromyxobacter sp. SG22]
MTTRLYLEDAYLREFEAEVQESAGGACTLSRTAFFPGGGGQPPDRGALAMGGEGGETLPVAAVHEDDAGRIWHAVGRELAPGQRVRGILDWPWRYALMRHHGLMHVVNTVAREAFGGIITGVQLGADRSRIDFRLPSFAREQIGELEARVNAVIERGLRVTSAIIGEEEFRARPELVRTLNVLPPVVDGRVRIVELEGFDAQACGGTHVHSTEEIGRARVARFDNKGKDNKRFYWELTG